MSKLKQWFDVNGWINYKNSDREGRCFYGSYDDYIINIIQRKGYKEVKTSIPNMTKDQGDDIIKHLNSYRGELKISKAGYADNVITITLKETFAPVKIEMIEKLLKSLTNCLYKVGIKDKNYCSKCGDFGASDYAEYKGIIMPLCNGCYQDIQQVWQQEIAEDQGLKAKEAAVTNENKAPESYLRGIVGALVGGLLGSIGFFFADRFKYVLMNYFTNKSGAHWYSGQIPRWYVAFVRVYEYSTFVFIALGIFLGYKLLRGKMGKPAPLIMIGISPIFLVINNIFIIALSFGIRYNGSSWMQLKAVLSEFINFFLVIVIQGPYVMNFWKYMSIAMAINTSMILIFFGLYKYRIKKAQGHNSGISA